ATRNTFHESDGKLLEITSSASRSEQSEGTYVSDIIMPLLRSSLGSLLNGSICLSTAERQNIASRNSRMDKERIEKKPNIMGL
ncbi:14114_t:CDS:2, partial [Gigaspora rosea]